jgi:hypothetical protein
MVLMVTDGDEMAAFRLCSCSSTWISLERGLEGTLADLRWHTILGMKLLEVEEKERANASCCNGVLPSKLCLVLYSQRG